MTNVLKLALLCLVVTLSGCATLSPQECHTANWKQIGENDGQSGYSSRIAQHYKACSKVNVIPNQKLYEFGYQEGQKYYCQPEVIFDKALQGGGSYHVCPVEQHARLRPFYDVPYAYYQSKKNRDALVKEIDKYQNYLLDKKLSKEKRDSYIDKIRDLKNDKNRLESDFEYAERRLNRFERDNGL